jgi:5-methylcytosine-specific restriction endonuclease McrA
MESKILEVNMTKTKEKKIIVPKEKSIRKETERWHFDNKYMELKNQWACLLALLPEKPVVNDVLNEEPLNKDVLNEEPLNKDVLDKDVCSVDKDVCREMKRQIQNKISSYKMQDIQKKKYDDDKFVDFQFVISLLVDKKLSCFYCKESVYLFYNYVRENKQWTLERIYNERGHNTDNVEIACLNCNLRRRTMYHERYLFTKQLSVVKLPGM